VCQAEEPASLYLYGEDVTARAGLFDALFDGPIDTGGFSAQPVILAALPSVEAGTAGLDDLEVRPGERVLDAATGAVVPLAAGVQLRQRDGSVLVYSGEGAASTVHTWAEFTLRPDLRWSDGAPLTADDSVFSFEVASSPETPLSKFLVERTAHYDAVEPLVVRWTSLPGWVDSQFALRFWTPLARHAYGRYSPAELLTLPEINTAPLGWGPFMAEPGGWTAGDRLTLVRNPHYFRAAEGLPRLDRVTFRFGLDPAAIVNAVADGTCDLGSAVTDYSAQLEAVLRAREAGALASQFVPDTVFEHLDFGLLPADGYRRRAGNDALADPRVRQAAAFCLDRQALIDELLGGVGEVAHTYVPSSHPLYGGDALATYPFDPARGQALLAEAGWLDADGDGVRERANRPLSLDLAAGPPDSAFRAALAEFVAGQLGENCGFEVVPALSETAALYDPWPSGLIFGRRFDLALFPWRTGSEPPCDLYVTAALPTDQNPGGANNTGYSTPEFDLACQGAELALDAATRQARHAEAQARFSQAVPSLPLFFRVKIGLAALRVQGYRLDSTARSDLWNVEEIMVLAP
jgi:peptide/nickel transport system substrate-binding protein